MAKPAELTGKQIEHLLPRRPIDAHKGLNGHALILAGSRGMGGAAVLAARGALRIGAGLVTVAIVDSERPTVTRQLPEALTLGLPESAEGVLTENALPVLREHAEKRRLNTAAIGPGLSVNAAVTRVIKTLLKEWGLPIVLDADGLNNMKLNELRGRPKLIITPHTGEMAKLLHVDIEDVKKSPVHLAECVAREHKLICVLKGHPSVITDGKQTVLNPTGNPAMATGGMGDVLTGAIVGLLAQGLEVWEAACAGVYLHGLAGDIAAESDRGLLATDVADALPRALAKIGVH